MPNKRTETAAFITACFFIFTMLTACAGSPVRTGWVSAKNRDNILLLSQGMTKTEVLKVMGQPHKTEAHGKREYWLYMTEGTTVDGQRIDDRNFTPLAFENGALIGWGQSYYEDSITVKVR